MVLIYCLRYSKGSGYTSLQRKKQQTAGHLTIQSLFVLNYLINVGLNCEHGMEKKSDKTKT